MTVLDKNALVNHMITKHRIEYGENISPIKLQKGLYFLFAFWGGEVKRQKDDGEESAELNLGNYDPELFNCAFEAWSYGPVDREVYINYKTMSEDDKNNICETKVSDDKTVSDYVDNLLDRIFASNDFGLVDLSHEDVCWNEVYERNSKHPMVGRDIIAEYAKR